MHVSPFTRWPVSASVSVSNPARIDLASPPYHRVADWARAAGDAIGPERQPSPYDRAQWFERTARLSGQAERPLIVGAEESIWLPLVLERRGRARALASWYTLAFRPVFARPDARSSECVARLAQAARGAGLHRIALAPVPEWDGSAALLAEGFRAAGWVAGIEEKTGNWVHEVGGPGWAEYLAERPGTLRSTIKRKAKCQGLTTHLHRTVDDELWRDYTSVFAESWKEDEGSLPFLRDLMNAAESDGSLRLGFARLDGVPIATQLWTVDGDTATIHKLAYREEHRTLSAGTVLSAALFQSAIDRDRVALIDYGTGDDGYKRDWMTTRRRLMRVTLTDPRAIAGAALLARDAAARLVATRLVANARGR